MFLSLIGLVGDLFVPNSGDSDKPGSMALAVVVNVGLITLFGIQRSISIFSACAGDS